MRAHEGGAILDLRRSLQPRFATRGSIANPRHADRAAAPMVWCRLEARTMSTAKGAEKKDSGH